MHIVFLSDYETQGGAAVAASRLAAELARNHRVTRLVLHPDGQRHAWRTLALSDKSTLTLWGRRVLRKLFMPTLELPGTSAYAEARLRSLLQRLKPDVINVHNLHGGSAWGWTPHLVNICAAQAPVVWTLHDMWSFTGRCAYAYDCRRFEQDGCDARCPTAEESPALPPERIAPAWHERLRLLSDHQDVAAVTPSRWLADEARRGLWRGHHVEVVPYGVPTAVFRPVDRTDARRSLGLATDGRVFLMVAQDLSERRKGAALLQQSWRHITGRGPWTLLTMGKGEAAFSDSRLRVRSLGHVANEARQALVYSAADILLHPAPVDNFPNVLLEALACGTPCLGLPVGGIPEIIHPGRTGWLAKDVSAASLADAANEALRDLERGCDLREPCRRQAETSFSLKAQAERYEALYREQLAKNRRKCRLSAAAATI